MAYVKQTLAAAVRYAKPKRPVELSERQLKNLKRVSLVALAIVAAAGFVLVTTVAPNIFMALDKIFGKKSYGSRRKTIDKREGDLTRSFYYLKRRGYVELIKQGHLLHVQVTEKGRKKLAKLDFETLAVPASGHWPKTWWIVLADIPSKPFRRQADLFRDKLKQMGFFPLQRTVWVYPFDPRDEVEYVATYYHIDRFVTTMEVKRLDKSDFEVLSEHFRQQGLIQKEIIR